MNNTTIENKSADYNEVNLPFDGFVNVNEVIAKRRHLRDMAAVDLQTVTAGSKDSEKKEDIK